MADRGRIRPVLHLIIAFVAFLIGTSAGLFCVRLWPGLPFEVSLAVYYVVKVSGDQISRAIGRNRSEWAHVGDYVYSELISNHLFQALGLATVATMLAPQAGRSERLALVLLSAAPSAGLSLVLRLRHEFELSQKRRPGRRVRVRHGLERLIALVLVGSLAIALVPAAAAAPYAEDITGIQPRDLGGLSPAGFATPEATVETFWQALAGNDWDLVRQCGLPGEQWDNTAQFVFGYYRLYSSATHYTISAETQGEQATVRSVINEDMVAEFSLTHLADGWHISTARYGQTATVEHATADLDVDLDGRLLKGHVNLRARVNTEGVWELILPVSDHFRITSLTVDGQPAQEDPDIPPIAIKFPRKSVGDVLNIEYSFSGKATERNELGHLQSDINKDNAFVVLQSMGLGIAESVDWNITVPDGQSVVTAGELVEKIQRPDNRTTWHFRQQSPQVSESFAINRYTPVTRAVGPVQVTWNLLPDYVDQGQEALDLTARILAYYGERLGPYPGDSLTVTEIPAVDFGGVSFNGFIMLNPIVTSGSSSPTWPDLVAHEIAHQWLAYAFEAHEGFLRESLVTYLATTFLERDQGEAEYQRAIDFHMSRYAEIPLSLDAPLSRPKPESQATLTYQKGAAVVYMLRNQIGDEAFWETLRQFTAQYRGRLARTADFFRVAERVSGQDLDWFQQQWVDSAKRLDLSVDHMTIRKTGGGYETSFVIRNRGQARVASVGYKIQSRGETVLERVALDPAKETRVTATTGGEPTSVMLDPGHELLDVNRRNDIAGTGPWDRCSPTRTWVTILAVFLITCAVGSRIVAFLRAHTLAEIRQMIANCFPWYRDVRQHGVWFDFDAVKPNVDYEALPRAEQVNICHPELWKDSYTRLLAADVGSTTTKALLWAKDDATGEFWLLGRAEAPTTVEKPWEDVTLGLTSAIQKLEAATGCSLMADGCVTTPPVDGVGVDLFVATSSAGGGLQMVVAGAMGEMTADSASRAASMAGGIVTDIMSIDDGRLAIDRIKRLRDMRPDMILLSGGTDGGEASHALSLAEQIAIAAPQPRLGGMKTPVVFAGNAAARESVERVLADKSELHIVDNLRPVLERENTEPVRQIISQLFMEHVMSRAPGYDRLKEWARNAVMPTPGAVGRAIQAFSDRYAINTVAFDIGGATTDVFSSFDGSFHRTVSANLGMSYSATNVLSKATPANILRWLPFEMSAEELHDWAGNKMIRPTTLPDTLVDLLIEQAFAREALRMAFADHYSLLGGLKGVTRQRDLAETFEQANSIAEVRVAEMDALIGSGGVLSHAPRREQALMMLIDAIQPEGVTEIFIDRIFISPQLGALSTINPGLASDILERDGLTLLGTCIAPIGRATRPDTVLAKVICTSGGKTYEGRVIAGRIGRLALPDADAPCDLVVQPRNGYDCGAGPGRPVFGNVEGGQFGIILDGRGRRSLRIPADASKRIAAQTGWMTALAAYDPTDLEEVQANTGSAVR